MKLKKSGQKIPPSNLDQLEQDEAAVVASKLPGPGTYGIPDYKNKVRSFTGCNLDSQEQLLQQNMNELQFLVVASRCLKKRIRQGKSFAWLKGKRFQEMRLVSFRCYSSFILFYFLINSFSMFFPYVFHKEKNTIIFNAHFRLIQTRG